MTKLNTYLERLLEKLGEFYPLLVFIVAQVLWLPALGVTVTTIQINAGLDFNAMRQLRITGFTAFLGINFLGIIWQMYRTRNLRQYLKTWRKDHYALDNLEKRPAWNEATRLAREYGWLTTALAVLQFAIAFASALRMHFNAETITYIFFGGFVGLVLAVQIAMVFHEWALRPIYPVVQPADPAKALLGLKPRWRTRWMAFALGLLLTSILLLAPIGYHQTYTVLYREVSSFQVFSQLRVQLIAASIFIMLVGIALAQAYSTSILTPIHKLLEAFEKVEAGDLTYRLPISTADEIGQVSVYFNRMLDEISKLQTELESRVAEQTAQLRATNAVGQAVTSILDPDQLTRRVVELISEQFGYYYAAIFLLDEQEEWAELRAASGEAGKLLLQRKHKLPVNGKNMVGTAIRMRQARIALDVGDEPVRFDNPFLPYTHSEIALPLIVGDRVLGALDVQSTKEAAFREGDIEILQGMANQVAVALSNARLFAETQQALHELENIQSRYLMQSWEAATGIETLEYEVGEPDTPVEAERIDIPITLRDQILGEITIDGNNWTEEDRIWAEALATQAAVALENARLLEESQQTALRERLIADISQKIWASRTIENILKTAVRELGQTLQAAETSIELNPEEQA